MQKPRTLPFIPGVSVIDLDSRFGAFRASLIRHWTRHLDGRPGEVWYTLVFRNDVVTYELPCERVTAAQLVSMEMPRRG